VPALLHEASRAELGRAGLVLSRLDRETVLRAHPGTPVVRTAVTGHGTLAPVVPALTAELARHGILLHPHVADFDSYVFDLSNPDSDLHAFDADVVLCLLDPRVFLDELPLPWRADDVAATLDRKLDLLEKLATQFRATGRGTLVLNTVPLPREATAQLLDYPSRARLGALWREANARLLRLPESLPGVVVLDLDPLLAEGVTATDPRMSVYAKAHLSAELLAGYAREAAHLVRALTGRTKKCLVVDLDETLWGGVLGDDGVEGIEVGGSYRGEAFAAFQRVLSQVAAQGVLLAAASKNDLEPVRQALREHPGMVLHEEDFVRIHADWGAKPDSLRALAEDLNLGADSFVFVDDNPYERGLVRLRLPDVTVVPVDTEPALHVEALLSDGWFDTVEITAEDRARPARYREELTRKDFVQGFGSVEDYLAELGVRVDFGPATGAQIPRMSQITLRTNQFNMTTERLQQSDVAQRAQGQDTEVLAIRSADRFGDNGVVGAVFTRREGSTLTVENFLLSCRVFSRGIEQTCLSALLRHAKDTGAAEVVGRYRRSAKNGKVHDLYERHGFSPAGTDGDGTEVFRHDLAEIPPAPEYVELTATLGGAPAVGPAGSAAVSPAGSPAGPPAGAGPAALAGSAASAGTAIPTDPTASHGGEPA
jgi:FkbH-like protein